MLRCCGRPFINILVYRGYRQSSPSRPSLRIWIHATGEVSPGGKSAPQRQKLHTDNVKQRLHIKSGSHVVLNVNLFDFMFLLVDYGKGLCSTAKHRCCF